MSLRFLIPLGFAACLAPAVAGAAERPVVVELFTSKDARLVPPLTPT